MLLFSLRKIFWLLILGTAHLQAHATLTPEQARLASDPGWLRLVHYESDRGSATGWRSAIHSPGFFLAGSAGRSDPAAELAATLAGLAQPADGAPDEHPQCRFPARRMWLAGKLGPALDLPALSCPKFERWTRGSTVESVSIVFATGYLGNPASYYGHALLKLNYASDQGRTRLQDASVNFGAILTGNDDPLSYMLKGVFGGYDGGFSDVQYHFHEHNYGENELRDLWEYRLDLPADAVVLIVGHAWEVLGQRYGYYFFRQNCAFRMAEIVQVAEGVEFIPPGLPWTIPQAMLQRLAVSRLEGRPLVMDVTRHPSRQTRFYERHDSLDRHEARVMAAVANGDEPLDGVEFNALTPDARRAVLDTLIDYYQFIADPTERASGKVHPRYAEVLAARYRLPPGERAVQPARLPPPHAGRPPSWVQLGWMQGSDFGSAWLLRLRPAYYDSLDAGSGHVPNATLAMGDLQVRFGNGGVRVHAFDLVSVESVNPGRTGLPGDRGEAWRLRFGVEPLRPGCEECLVMRLQGDIGVGRHLSERLYAAIHGGGAIQEARGGEGPGFVRASMDVIAKPWPQLAVRLGYELRAPVDARRGPYGIGRAELRLAIGARSDFRIRHEQAEGAVTSVAAGWYW